MSRLSFFITSIILCLFINNAAKSQTIPASIQEIPVFLGAVPNILGQEQALLDLQDVLIEQPVYAVKASVYTINTIPDEICRFYIKRLNAVEGLQIEEEGEHTRPWYELNFFPESWYENQYERNTKIWDGDWFKTALAKRKQWTPGNWLQQAYFEWTIVLDNGDVKRLSIEILDDDSFDTRSKIVSDQSLITFRSYIEKSDED